MSRRNAYRDLRALDDELGIPVWAEGGRWGLESEALLPAFRLTQGEAMAVFLAARLMAKYADAYDPELAAAFQKLGEALPEVLGRHVHRTLDVMARRPPDPEGTRRLRALTQAWAERRVVELTYDTSTYDPARAARTARVRPYLIEPSTETHALYLIGWDETRDAIRTFKLERIRAPGADPGRVRRRRPTASSRRPSSGPGGSSPTRARWRWCCASARRSRHAWPRPPGTRPRSVRREPDGSLTWRATVSGTVEIRSWILAWGPDVEVIAPAALRDEVAGLLAAAAGHYR